MSLKPKDQVMERYIRRVDRRTTGPTEVLFEEETITVGISEVGYEQR